MRQGVGSPRPLCLRADIFTGGMQGRVHVPYSGLFSRVMENVRDAQLDCLSLGSLRPLLAQMD